MNINLDDKTIDAIDLALKLASQQGNVPMKYNGEETTAGIFFGQAYIELKKQVKTENNKNKNEQPS